MRRFIAYWMNTATPTACLVAVAKYRSVFAALSAAKIVPKPDTTNQTTVSLASPEFQRPRCEAPVTSAATHTVSATSGMTMTPLEAPRRSCRTCLRVLGVESTTTAKMAKRVRIAHSREFSMSDADQAAVAEKVSSLALGGCVRASASTAAPPTTGIAESPACTSASASSR